MQFSKERGKAVDRFRSIVESERIQVAKLRELLEDGGDFCSEDWQTTAEDTRQPADDLREKIAELEEKADEIENAASLVEAIADRAGEVFDKLTYYEMAEGRDEKAETKDDLLGSLQELIDAFDEAEGTDAPDGDDDDDPPVGVVAQPIDGGLFEAALEIWGNRWVLYSGDDSMEAHIAAETIHNTFDTPYTNRTGHPPS